MTYSTDPIEWVDHARVDLSAAEALLDVAEVPARVPCFWAHECAQKAVKGVLLKRDIEFQFESEDLEALLELLPEELDLHGYRARAREFADYDMWILYPSDRRQPTNADAQNAVNCAREILDTADRLVRCIRVDCAW